ncbi:Low-density lipoprotein receptor domain class A, partial [Ancylostoma duodenale]
TSVLRNACNCSIFHSLAVDENARVLYVSCQSLTGVGYVYVFRIKCQLDGRKCEAWLSKDLWPGTRIHADGTYLRLFYTCPSGVWSRDVGVVSSNVRHHFVSSIANDYSVAPLDENSMLVAQISSNPSTCILNVACSAWQFACDDGQSCVHYAKKCDRIPDCGDGSDESPSLCRNVSPDRWPCNDGFSTIDRALLCNGQVDCEDGSDERHCREAVIN